MNAERSGELLGDTDGASGLAGGASVPVRPEVAELSLVTQADPRLLRVG
jgi:hypothetical protein